MSTLTKIKKLLKEKNIKQNELTDYLGISKNNFTNWNAGTSISYTKYIPQIAEFFNVSSDYLLGTENFQMSEQTKIEIVKSILFPNCDNITDKMFFEIIRYAKLIELAEKYNI